MSFHPPELEEIWLHPESVGSQLHRRFLKFYDPAIFKELSQNLNVEEDSPSTGTLSPSEFNRSKKRLLLTPFKGQFFKRCPGATQKKALACCNYHVLNLGLQCNFNCSYCYLQNYINSPMMKYYSNLQDAIDELREMAIEHREQPFRVGTGEVIDSLSMDPITLYSRDLIEFFKDFPKWTLEFKTKSDLVDQFLDVPHSGNVVVSWSINPQKVVSSEEHGTASLQNRLEAAQKVFQKGFQVAFHIDPMIYFEGWKDHYAELVRDVKSRFRPEDINVISVGSLRTQPEQRHMMRARFGMKSLVMNSELFPSDVGKLRYPQHLREEMYRFVLNEFGSGWKIFFCMETPETWISAYANTPMKVPGLKDLFKPLPRLAKSTELVDNGT